MAAADPAKPTKRATARPAEGMAGLAKGLAIIEALCAHGGQSAADAARASGSSRAAARRCLLTLAELGYVERVGREFRPLVRLRNLGREQDVGVLLAKESEPLLAAARDLLNESVSLAVLDGDRVVFLVRSEAQHIVSTGVRVGATLPAYCSATGRVLLAGLPAEALRAHLASQSLTRRTPNTLTDPERIVAAVSAASVAGFAISDEELEVGMRSLAVPVRDLAGATVAAVSVSAHTARISSDVLRDRFVPALEACVGELQARCFGRGRSVPRGPDGGRAASHGSAD